MEVLKPSDLLGLCLSSLQQVALNRTVALQKHGSCAAETLQSCYELTSNDGLVLLPLASRNTCALASVSTGWCCYPSPIATLALWQRFQPGTATCYTCRPSQHLRSGCHLRTEHTHINLANCSRALSIHFLFQAGADSTLQVQKTAEIVQVGSFTRFGPQQEAWCGSSHSSRYVRQLSTSIVDRLRQLVRQLVRSLCKILALPCRTIAMYRSHRIEWSMNIQ